MKKVIAFMTLGKNKNFRKKTKIIKKGIDVSRLFSEMCMVNQFYFLS